MSAAAVGAVVLCVLIALIPGTARAAIAPVITNGPAIGGPAHDTAILQANARWTGDPSPIATWTWMRCVTAAGPCAAIDGATSSRYAVTWYDVGSVLRVRLRVSNDAGTDQKRSQPTAVVAPAPPPPAATPTPTVTPTSPSDSIVVPAAAAPATAGAPEQTVSPPPMLEPFPIIRIKGAMTPRGSRVTLLSVKAPQGARVVAVCRGGGCPVRRLVPAAGVSRLRPFERNLRAGTRLEVSVTKAGYIGKFTVIVIRRRAAPRRSDRCLQPGVKRAVRCPTA